MNAPAKIEAVTMRTPFPAHHISKLPKETKAQIDERKSDRAKMVFNCAVCGGHHHKNAVHLDYVGHAALTDRLLDVDPEWSWEPVAFNSDGLPAFDRIGGLWIKLTVLGVTRLGYGCADGKSGGDAIKEIIGDALRNAAMRFGAALDLWHKGDLHLDDTPEQDGGHSQSNGAVSPLADGATITKIIQLCEAVGGSQSKVICNAYKVGAITDLTATQADAVVKRLTEKLADKAKSQTDAELADEIQY